ncbi:MAG: PIN domain-containing protein [Pseudomonadales bacterium]|jgi:hypothetical protein|nr:PIN domain-containing protein [Pseudomonadales bacterium]MDP7597862.1 PIN domain-containing protein [Pseudomonadales bacterium]HJN51098.1 PIN domain-containing protein [Pseudomonadales bacterium]|tara:strand:- start:1219 stop:1611 length:393 start_codon:yes stop_codon:yes gene_type:complete
MILVDTSVWILVLRDSNGRYAKKLRAIEGDQDLVFTRFTQLELCQGARDEFEWALLSEYLSDQVYIETSSETWKDAARIYFDLRRRGKTVHSPIDCCIAQLALENDLTLLHRDKDFQTIAAVRSLRAQRF